MSEQHIQIANILFATLSFGSFIIGLVSVFLNQFCYSCYKDRYPVDTTGGIFFSATVAVTFLELVDSFQWLMLLKSDVACTVLGAVREYAMISLLVTLICLGIHLCIIMIHPKCLKVIKEEKQRRYTLLQRSYIFATFTIPVLIVPWPFMIIETKYGKDEYLCWLASSCISSNATVSYVIGRLLMWHFWAFLAWMFAVAMLVLATYRYCRHKSASNGSYSRPSQNVCTLIPMLLTYVIAITANAVLFIWELITRKFSFPITVLAIVTIPLMLVVYAFIEIIRLLRVINSKSIEIGAITNASLATYDTSYGATHFILPDNEYD